VTTFAPTSVATYGFVYYIDPVLPTAF